MEKTAGRLGQHDKSRASPSGANHSGKVKAAQPSKPRASPSAAASPTSSAPGGPGSPGDKPSSSLPASHGAATSQPKAARASSSAAQKPEPKAAANPKSESRAAAGPKSESKGSGGQKSDSKSSSGQKGESKPGAGAKSESKGAGGAKSESKGGANPKSDSKTGTNPKSAAKASGNPKGESKSSAHPRPESKASTIPRTETKSAANQKSAESKSSTLQRSDPKGSTNQKAASKGSANQLKANTLGSRKPEKKAAGNEIKRSASGLPEGKSANSRAPGGGKGPPAKAPAVPSANNHVQENSESGGHLAVPASQTLSPGSTDTSRLPSMESLPRDSAASSRPSSTHGSESHHSLGQISATSDLPAPSLPSLGGQSPLGAATPAPPFSKTPSPLQADVIVNLEEGGEAKQGEDFFDVHSDLAGGPHERPRQVQLGFPTAPYGKIAPLNRQPSCCEAFQAVLLFLGSLLLFLPFTIILVVCLPLFTLLRALCRACCCCRRGQCCLCCCHAHLTAPERLWLRASLVNTMVVQSLVIVQRGLDLEHIRDLISTRLVLAENRHGQRLYPRFTQRVQSFCCGYAWVRDPNFFINNHVVAMPACIGSLEELQEHVSELASRPLHQDAPLWELLVLEDFGPQRDTVLLFRMHPAMTDGVTMMRIFEKAVVDSQMITSPPSYFAGGAPLWQWLRAWFYGPLFFLSSYVCRRGDFNLLHGRHVHPSGRMSLVWSQPFSRSATNRIRQVTRCSLNELLLSVAAGNLRTYMQVCGIEHPYNVHCALPVDFQPEVAKMGTGGRLAPHLQQAWVLLPLCSNTEGAIPRLWASKLALSRLRHSMEPAALKGAVSLSGSLLPEGCFRRLWRHVYSHCTCTISCLTGPEANLRLATREIKCVLYWSPPPDRVAVSISFLAYGDQVRMAVLSDRSVLPNPELITQDFIFQMENLSKTLAHRRIPGEQISRRIETMHMLQNYTITELTSEQLQLQMALVQQELHDLKLQLESQNSRRISSGENHLRQRIETLKEQFRELMVELRKKRASEECVVALTDELEDEGESDRPQKPFRRRTMSVSSKLSTASVSSTIRPLSTAASNQPSPTHSALPSWPELEATDVEQALQSKKSGYKQKLSTMEEYELDESGSAGNVFDNKRYRTF